MPHPYSDTNTDLLRKMDAAVREGVGEVELPPEVERIANGDNDSNSNGGYSWTDRVAHLEGEVFRLENEVKWLKEKGRDGSFVSEVKRSLHIFEENLALYLYPRGRMFGKTEIFPRLMNWLNVRRDEPEGAVANNKWLNAQREVQWNTDHEHVLTKSRSQIFDMAQPVEMWNPVSFTEVERRCIADLNHLSRLITEWIDNEGDA